MKNMKNEKCLAESRNQNLTVKRYMAHFINISLFYGHKSDNSAGHSAILQILQFYDLYNSERKIIKTKLLTESKEKHFFLEIIM